MSTDPTQPAQRPGQSPPELADDPAPPTVRAPRRQDEPQPAPAPPPRGAGDKQEATRPVRQWQAPPPPVPGPGPGSPPERAWDEQQSTRMDRPAQPAFRDAQPTRRDQSPRPGGQDQPPAAWQQDARQQDRREPGQWQQPPQDQWQPQDQRTRQLPPEQAAGPWPPALGQPPQDRQPGRRRGGRRRRVRGSVVAVFSVLVLLVLLVIGDRVACAVAENEFASQAQSSGLPVKPSVDIEGFPFLTQLIAKDFNKVDLSASNIPAGPVTIATVKAVATGLHISGLSSSATATADHVTATAFIPLGALAAAGGLPDTGIKVTPDGTDKLKITADLGGLFSDTEEAQISQTGPQTISIKLLSSGGALGSVLGQFGSFSFNLPKGVPPSLRITAVTVNSQGLTVVATASHATFSKS